MTSPRIAVIDYGIGNLRSAEKALQFVGADAFLTTSPNEVASADGVVLPGVGAMARCMQALEQSGLQAATVDALQSGRPFLGVCVGMQMLHAASTEHGGVEGLGFFRSVVDRIAPVGENGEALKIPHMQWNKLRSNGGGQLLAGAGIKGDPWVYFVHSFAALPHDDVVATTDYGGPITALVERGKVFGTQFHPEKSGEHGLALLRSFADVCVNDRSSSRVA